jgi:CBS domain-containing protein
MKVRDIMTKRVDACTPDADLGTVACMMWRRDCGAIPVIEPQTRKVLGVVTDRDIAIGLGTSGKRPDERLVSELIGTHAYTIEADTDVRDAMLEMQRHQVRRLPVTNGKGELEGMLSLNDLILHAESGGPAEAHVSIPELMRTVRLVSEHRSTVLVPDDDLLAEVEVC